MLPKKTVFLTLLCLFLLASFLAWRNLGLQDEVCGGDAGCVLLFPESAWRISLFVWDEANAPGADGRINLPRLFPFLSSIVLLKKIGLTTLIIQRIIFILYIFVPALSMYFLLSYLLKDDFPGRGWILFLGSLFYASNRFTMILLSHPVALGELYIFYLFTPLLLLVFIKGLRGGRVLNSSIAAAFLFMMAIVGNLAYSGLVALLLICYFSWHLVVARNYRHSFQFALCFTVWAVLFSSWFLLPYVTYIFAQKGKFVELFELGKLAYLRLLSTRTSLVNVFRLCGELWDNQQDINSLQPLSKNPFFIVSSYFLPLLALSALLDRKNRKIIVFFTLLALVMIFLAKGIHPPLAGPFLWLYQHLPGFSIYRNSYDKFSFLIAFSYAILISFALALFSRRINRHWARSIVYLTCLAAIGFTSGLLWQGRVLRWPNFKVQVPPAYYQSGDDLADSAPAGYKILKLPPVKKRMVKVSWGYMGVDVWEFLALRPVFNYYKLYKLLGQGKEILGRENIADYLGLFNIGYALLDDYSLEYAADRIHKDNIFTNVEQEKARYRNYLEEDFEQEKVTGGIELYSLAEQYLVPHIYALTNPLVVVGDKGFVGYLDINKYVSGESIRFLSSSPKRSLGYPALLDNDEDYPGEIDWVICSNETIAKPLAGEKNRVHFFNNNITEEDFFLPTGGNYLITAGVIPKMVSLRLKEDDAAAPRIDFREFADCLEASGINVTHDYEVDLQGGLVSSVFFDGGADEDEYQRIKIAGLDIDLRQWPCLEMVYQVEDSRVQIIELVLGVDTNNDQAADRYLKGIYQRSRGTDFTSLFYNVYAKLKKQDPNVFSARLVSLELYPHKYWRVDCRDQKKDYQFRIKEVVFFKGWREEQVPLSWTEKLPRQEGESAVNYLVRLRQADLKPDYRPSLEVDGEEIVLGGSLRKRISLSAGGHKLKNLLTADGNLQLNWVRIEPEFPRVVTKALPTVEYEEISPVSYHARAKSPVPFWLVFSEGFDPGWQAYVYQDGFSARSKIMLWNCLRGVGKRKKIDPHCQVNGYANGWYIGEEDLIGGKCLISLEYQPQIFFELGCLVSGLSILGALSVLVIRKIYGRKH